MYVCMYFIFVYINIHVHIYLYVFLYIYILIYFLYLHLCIFIQYLHRIISNSLMSLRSVPLLNYGITSAPPASAVTEVVMKSDVQWWGNVAFTTAAVLCAYSHRWIFWNWNSGTGSHSEVWAVASDRLVASVAEWQSVALTDCDDTEAQPQMQRDQKHTKLVVVFVCVCVYLYLWYVLRMFLRQLLVFKSAGFFKYGENPGSVHVLTLWLEYDTHVL